MGSPEALKFRSLDSIAPLDVDEHGLGRITGFAELGSSREEPAPETLLIIGKTNVTVGLDRQFFIVSGSGKVDLP
jgi:hypothetical protein